MGIKKGLAATEKAIEDRRGGPKTKWLSLKDGESVKLRFVSELDPDSPAYREENGLAIAVGEHTNPKDFKRKALCTLEDEGQCFGCEMTKLHPKTGWASKNKMYTNVYVTPVKAKGADSVPDPYVAVYSFSLNDKSVVWQTLKELYSETGAISDKVWSLKRSGDGFNNTTYLLRVVSNDDKPFVYEEDVVNSFYNLEEVAVRQIPYAEQEVFYMGGEDEKEEEPKQTKDADLGNW